MKAKMLLLMITLAVGALMVLMAQLIPRYHDALFTALPFLALAFCLLLMILNSKMKAQITDPDSQRKMARRARTRNIVVTILGLVFLAALAVILYLPGVSIALPIVLLVIVCVGSIGIAFWMERPFRSGD